MIDQYTRYIHDDIALIPYGTEVIEAEAFLDCQDIKKVVIPNTVKRIGSGAFSGCYLLTDIEIPNSVRFIGESAFCGCGFSHIDLPDSVIEIGKSAFLGSSIVDFVLPSSIIRIEESTFSDCRQLNSVKLSKRVEHIGAFAFYGCESLSSISIPESVRTIGDVAFWGCKSIQHLHIPRGVSSIGENAFRECTGIDSITNSSLSYCAIQNCLISIHGDLLFGCKNAIIPENANIKIIKNRAFYCQDIQNLVVPYGVKRIEKDAFGCCTELTQIKLPCSLEYIEGNPFSYCSHLSSIEADYFFLESNYFAQDNCLLDYSKTILYIGCNNSIIPYTVKEIHHIAFLGSGIKKVLIPRGVQTIGNYAFEDCLYLEWVRIPSTIVNWGYGAFCGCQNLRTIELFIEQPSAIGYKEKLHFTKGLELSQVSLIVPIGTGYEYRNDPVFGQCKEILPRLREEPSVPTISPDLLF